MVRNDELTVEEIRQMAPEALILSPGPGRPKEAGICEQAAKELAGEFPILGVCLGHQAIYEVIWRNGFLRRKTDAWKTVRWQN